MSCALTPPVSLLTPVMIRVGALSYGELFEMTQSVDMSDLSREELRRFRRMDLALEVADENGDPCYLAVEIAFYAEQEGIDRAIANARLLERFTSCLSHAVVAVGRDYRGLPQSVLNGEYPILLDSSGLRTDLFVPAERAQHRKGDGRQTL